MINRPSSLRVVEDRRKHRVVGGLCLVFLAWLVWLVWPYMNDPLVDDVGRTLGWLFFGVFLGLPAFYILVDVLPWSSSLVIDTRDQTCRVQQTFYGLPVRRAEVELRYARVGPGLVDFVETESNASGAVSTAGCLIGLLGPLGALVGGLMVLSQREQGVVAYPALLLSDTDEPRASVVFAGESAIIDFLNVMYERWPDLATEDVLVDLD